MKMQAIRRRRAGFTLVELLVAMALIVLIMAILGEAFAEGLKVVRRAKGIGDLQDNLRTAVVPLRSDLLQRHFDGSEKLSTSFKLYTRPGAGFFRVQQGAVVVEGNDGNGLSSNRAAQDIVHMTVIKVGSRRTDYLSALAPALTATPTTDPCRPLWEQGPADYMSNWNGGEFYTNSQRAEVMWFLQPMMDPENPAVQLTAGGGQTPLYTLHRTQRLIVTDSHAALNGSTTRIPVTEIGKFPEVACVPDPNEPPPATNLYFPRLDEYGNVSMRAMMSGGRSVGTPLSGTQAGEDRVIGDVISFEMKVLMDGDFRFKTVNEIQQEQIAKGHTFPGGDGVFDTADWPTNDPAASTTGNTNPINVTVKAVEIIIRVWDHKTEQTRQITVIQDM